jgi:hypothetical protein
MSGYSIIKQLMVIPEHLAALTKIEEGDITVWEDLTEYGWPQFFALVEGDYQTDDRIYLYQTDITGDVDMVTDYMMVYKRICPECGSPMRIFAYANYPEVIHYRCECGHHLETTDMSDIVLKNTG